MFAEILNDSNSVQTKLIKVNLNNYETQRIGGINYGGFRPMVFASNAAPRSYNLKSMNFYSAAPRMMNCARGAAPKMHMMKKSAAPKMGMMEKNAALNIKNNCINSNNSIYNAFNHFNNNANNGIKDEITRLILSQDIIEGAWNENEETKKIINIIGQNKFILIDNKVKGLNKGSQVSKILYTILVIYYLMTNYSDKLNDYRLVINKAKKYLMSQGVNYEEFIVGIA